MAVERACIAVAVRGEMAEVGRPQAGHEVGQRLRSFRLQHRLQPHDVSRGGHARPADLHHVLDPLVPRVSGNRLHQRGRRVRRAHLAGQRIAEGEVAADEVVALELVGPQVRHVHRSHLLGMRRHQPRRHTQLHRGRVGHGSAGQSRLLQGETKGDLAAHPAVPREAPRFHPHLRAGVSAAPARLQVDDVLLGVVAVRRDQLGPAGEARVEEADVRVFAGQQVQHRRPVVRRRLRAPDAHHVQRRELGVVVAAVDDVVRMVRGVLRHHVVIVAVAEHDRAAAVRSPRPARIVRRDVVHHAIAVVVGEQVEAQLVDVHRHVDRRAGIHNVTG